MVILATRVAAPHLYEASLETSLDFIDTLEHRRTSLTDHLPSVERAASWLVERRLLDAADSDRAFAGVDALDRLRRTRAALRAVVDAAVGNHIVELGAVEEVNRILAQRQALELVAVEDGIVLGRRHDGEPLDRALSALAESLVRGVTSERRGRLRACANESCRTVFFDASRTPRRRWCDMSTCGNQAKAARHRARAKGDRAPGA